MSAWVDQMFQAQAASGGVVRRARADVDKLASLQEVIAEARARGFHVVETGDQVVVLCHPGQMVIHC